VPSYELQYQFLPKNKFLKTEFELVFITPLMIKQKKLFYVQDCAKKMLVTANIYYMDSARKNIYFIIINIYNYIFIKFHLC